MQSFLDLLFYFHLPISTAGFKGWEDCCFAAGVDALFRPWNGKGIPSGRVFDILILNKSGDVCLFFAQRYFLLLIWFKPAQLNFKIVFSQFRDVEVPVRSQPGTTPNWLCLKLVVVWFCAWRCWFTQSVRPTWRKTAWTCRLIYCDTLNVLYRHCLCINSPWQDVKNLSTLHSFVGSFALPGLLSVCIEKRLFLISYRQDSSFLVGKN